MAKEIQDTSNEMFDFIVSIIRTREYLDQKYCDKYIKIKKRITKCKEDHWMPGNFKTEETFKIAESSLNNRLEGYEDQQQRIIHAHKGGVQSLRKMCEHFQHVFNEKVKNDSELDEATTWPDEHWYEFPYQYIVRNNSSEIAGVGYADEGSTVGFQKDLEEADFMKPQPFSYKY